MVDDRQQVQRSARSTLAFEKVVLVLVLPV